MNRNPLPLALAAAALTIACTDRDRPSPRAAESAGNPGRGASGAQERTGGAEASPARELVRAVSSKLAAAAPGGRVDFQPYQIVDRAQGGLVVGTLAVPAGWKAESEVTWTYPDVSLPVRLAARVSAPDGSVWLESFPSELFYWLEPGDTLTAVGGRTLGMIHRPGIGVEEAMQRFLVGRYRSRVQNLRVVGFQQIPNLPQSLGKAPIAGDSVAARVAYTWNGRPVEEEFYCLLTAGERIPYHGPQGTTIENHRALVYAFSMGAMDGRLDGLKPTLGVVASSFRPDPVWERHRQNVQAAISAQFNRNIAAGYQQIAAAGALSRQISANNDAMIQALESQRAATNRSMDRVNDNFSQYIRGTERMEDPYTSTGTSEHSYNNQYHWTDGFGSYQHSNDANFNPNIGSTQSWQLMQPAK